MLEVTTSGGESGCLTLPAPHLLMVIGQAKLYWLIHNSQISVLKPIRIYCWCHKFHAGSVALVGSFSSSYI